MTITPAPPASVERVKELLAEGKTASEVAEIVRWPRQRVVALINGVRGWLLDPVKDTVYEPGRPNKAPIVPKAEFREPDPATAPAAVAITPDSVTVLPVHQIEPHPANVRADLGELGELAASIKARGILQPIVVTRHPGSPGLFRILAGHRRHAAAQLAGLTAVPVVIRGLGVEHGEAIELMLIENCHRADLNPAEKAEAFAELRRIGYSQASIAERTGLSQSTVSYFLSLMELDEATRGLVRSGDLAVGDAIGAVRKARQKARKQGGRTADYSWEPDYLAKTHPLARKARNLCDARDHGMRRRIGKTACGQCWETAIRQDEGTVLRASLAQDAP